MPVRKTTGGDGRARGGHAGVPRCPDPGADAEAPEALRRLIASGETPEEHAGILLYLCQPIARRSYNIVGQFLGRNESSLRRWRARYQWAARIAIADRVDGERWAAYLLGRMYPGLLARTTFEKLIPGAEDVLASFQGTGWSRRPAPVFHALPEEEQEDQTQDAEQPEQPVVKPEPARPIEARREPSRPQPAPDPQEAVLRSMLGMGIRDLQTAQASTASGQPVDSPLKPRSSRDMLAVLESMRRLERDKRDQAPAVVTTEDDPEADMDGLRVRRALATGDERLILAAVLDEADEVSYLARRLLGTDPDVPGRLELLNGGRR